jgi:hypothetical protein
MQVSMVLYFQMLSTKETHAMHDSHGGALSEMGTMSQFSGE